MIPSRAANALEKALLSFLIAVLFGFTGYVLHEKIQHEERLEQLEEEVAAISKGTITMSQSIKDMVEIQKETNADLVVSLHRFREPQLSPDYLTALAGVADDFKKTSDEWRIASSPTDIQVKGLRIYFTSSNDSGEKERYSARWSKLLDGVYRYEDVRDVNDQPVKMLPPRGPGLK